MSPYDMSYNWGNSLKRRKHQRKVTRAIRRFNKVLEKDELWKGRYFVRIVNSNFEVYEDKSGAMLHTTLEFCDKKTGQTKLEYVDEYGICKYNSYKLFDKMNTFIVVDCDVWVKDKPREDKTDYTKVKFERKEGNGRI